MSEKDLNTAQWHSAADDEISFRELVSKYLSRWRSLTFLTLLFVALGAIVYETYPGYESKGVILVENTSSSSLQALSSTLSGLGLRSSKLSSGSELISKYRLIFQSRSFHMELLNKLRAQRVKPSSNQELRALQLLGWNYLDNCLLPNCKKLSDDELAVRLMKLSKISEGESDSLEVSFLTAYREVSAYLVNTFLSLATTRIVDDDLQEIEKARSFLEKEILQSEARQQELNSSVVDYRTRNKILTLDPQHDNLSAIVAEMRSKINDTELKIAENRRLAQALKLQAGPDTEGSGKYGSIAELKQLENENLVLQARIDALNKSLKSSMLGTASLPSDQQRLITLGKESEIEFTIYQELRQQLVRLNLQRLSAAERVRVVERASPDTVRRKPDILTLIVVALVLSQLFGSLWVFVGEARKPGRRVELSVVPAQEPSEEPEHKEVA